MVVEVTSYDTDERDREEKPSAYAQTGIPVYLLIDRDSCEALVYSEPDGNAYAKLIRCPFGQDHRAARSRGVLPGHRAVEGLGALKPPSLLQARRSESEASSARRGPGSRVPSGSGRCSGNCRASAAEYC